MQWQIEDKKCGKGKDKNMDKAYDENKDEDKDEDKDGGKNKGKKDLPPLRVVAPQPATSTRVSVPPKLPLIISIWLEG